MNLFRDRVGNRAALEAARKFLGGGANLRHDAIGYIGPSADPDDRYPGGLLIGFRRDGEKDFCAVLIVPLDGVTPAILTSAVDFRVIASFPKEDWLYAN